MIKVLYYDNKLDISKLIYQSIKYRAPMILNYLTDFKEKYKYQIISMTFINIPFFPNVIALLITATFKH